MRWLVIMLVFVPLSLMLHLMHAAEVWVFLTSSLAIVPLAGYMGNATEELAKRFGPGVGGLLNATFGNATELIIAVFAVRAGQTDVVKASLIGSILGNVLLVLGLSVFLGGIKHKIQTFNKDVAQSHSAMLGVAVISLLVPALFVSAARIPAQGAEARIQGLSTGVSAVLVALYFGSLIFSLRTHEDLFRSVEGAEEEPPLWKKRTAFGALIACTLAVAFESEMLVGSIDPVVAKWHVSKVFLGIILIPLVGNAAEHSTAVMMALKNKMDISLNIAISSSTQIAMFAAPLIIFLSPLLGHPVSILFNTFELAAVTAAAAIAVLISMDGKSHWLEGAQLLATYLIVALAFYYIAG
jgi:Ca2+:H+ antiporter